MHLLSLAIPILVAISCINATPSPQVRLRKHPRKSTKHFNFPTIQGNVLPSTSCGIKKSDSSGIRNRYSSSISKVEYYENPSFPQEDKTASMCMVQIEPMSNEICQIRLDFEEFSLDGGSSINQPCDRDSMTIMSPTKGNLGIGPLCGNNKGQHVYIPVKEGTDGFIFSIHTPARTNALRNGYKWRIKVTQVNCAYDKDLVAPHGCVQYHTDKEGHIRSYNFDSATRFMYPLNLDYAICFKPAAGACQIRFERTPGLPPYSTAVGQVKGYNMRGGKCGLNNGCGSEACVAMNDNKLADYLLIPRGLRERRSGGFMLDKYYCGAGVGYDGSDDIGEKYDDGTSKGNGVASKIVGPGPVVIHFHSDDRVGVRINKLMDGYDEIGFSLRYTYQNTCTEDQNQGHD